MLLDIDPRTGTFVNTRHRELAEVVNDYNPDLFVVHVPPHMQRFDEQPGRVYPFAVVERRSLGEPHLVFMVEEKAMDDESVLAAIFERDITKNGGPSAMMSRIQARNNAAKILQHKRAAEAREQQKDEHLTMLQSKKHFYKHTDGRVYS